MTSRTRTIRRVVPGSLMFFSVLTCSSGSSERENLSLSDPDVFEAKATQSFVPVVDGIIDGLNRLFTALDGGASDGVVVIPNANGADATLSLDLDGNGSRESSVNGSLSGDIAVGAPVVVAAVATSEPSLTGSGSFVITETSPGVVVLDNMTGTGGSDAEGHHNAADVEVTDGTVSVDVATGVPAGFIDLSISGEGSTLDISVVIESDGHGGYQLHITGSGLDFTIP